MSSVRPVDIRAAALDALVVLRLWLGASVVIVSRAALTPRVRQRAVLLAFRPFDQRRVMLVVNRRVEERP